MTHTKMLNLSCMNPYLHLQPWGIPWFFIQFEKRDSSCVECHSELKTTTTWRKHMHIDHNMIFYSRRERQSLCLMSFRVKDDDDLRKLCQVKLFQELIRQKFCLHSQAPSPASPPQFSRKASPWWSASPLRPAKIDLARRLGMAELTCGKSAPNHAGKPLNPPPPP